MTNTHVTQQVSIARRIRDLVAARPDERVFLFIGEDGAEPAFTWAELDRRSSQLAGALAERGLGFGDRLGIGFREPPPVAPPPYGPRETGGGPPSIRPDPPALARVGPRA